MTTDPPGLSLDVWSWKRELARCAFVFFFTLSVGGLVAQMVTFPSRNVSPERDEHSMLMDTVFGLALVAAAGVFLAGLAFRRRR